MLKPGATIGILGGGQLARMMALAAAPLGLKCHIFAPAGDNPAFDVAAAATEADYTDEAALERFAEVVDVVTYEFENVPARTAEVLAAHRPVHPNPRALAVTQDRLTEKTFIRDLGLPVPDFRAIDSLEDLKAGAAAMGGFGVLKTRRFGYDGKGQAMIRPETDLTEAWDKVGHAPSILEAFVPFEREVSVVAVRGRDGEFRAWPLTENWHRDGILSASMAPCADGAALEPQAVAYAKRVAESLDYVGVFALELFVRDGQLLANEMAPRVHNSGHWTIEGAETSQFENHLRAVLGLPLGNTAAVGHSVMLNWVGAMPEAAPVLRSPAGHWHDYGKTSREGRKVGHATLRAEDRATLRRELETAVDALSRREEFSGVIARLG